MVLHITLIRLRDGSSDQTTARSAGGIHRASGKNCKREVNNSFSSYSVTTAVNMLMQRGCDPPPTLHLFYVLCVTLVLHMQFSSSSSSSFSSSSSSSY